MWGGREGAYTAAILRYMVLRDMVEEVGAGCAGGRGQGRLLRVLWRERFRIAGLPESMDKKVSMRNK